ncbi:proline racemase family protein, partial [Klebsiella pneumoniae]|uniref:proline racemase family protein n=1 Tax=Klebsiella pneumoniae TaxID=573 RepID=UPI0016430350
LMTAPRPPITLRAIDSHTGGVIDHIELFADDDTADSRSFVLCPGKAWDRSPCGTGTSAKLACLAQDGKLQPGEIWRQASIIGSQFTASYQRTAEGIIPTIRGEAWVCGDNQLILNPDDPFCWGIAP